MNLQRIVLYIDSVLEDPPICMQETVDTWLMYFGFNLTMPCASVADDITYLQDQWNSIIAPLCADRPNNTVSVLTL